jgi:chromosome segregation ATPase
MMQRCQDLISWKHSFKRLSEEYDLANKKKQALDNLLGVGRISQSTYDSFSKEIQEAIIETERQQQALQEKMNARTGELEAQINTLEMLLANFEIQHVTGEVNDDVYQRQVDLLSIGLENSRKELEMVKEAVGQLSSGSLTLQQEIEMQPSEQEAPKAEAEAVEIPVSAAEEKTPEPPIEPIKACQQDSQLTQTETKEQEKQEKPA